MFTLVALCKLDNWGQGQSREPVGGYCSGPRGENPGLNEGASHENGDECPYSGSIPKANPLGFADGASMRHGGKNEIKDDSRILACTPGRTLVREEIWN